jgi:hypothetical protein
MGPASRDSPWPMDRRMLQTPIGSEMNMNDRTILEHISELVEEEHRLLAHADKPEQNHERLKHIAEQLDQCWDLLRQRRAKREFGADPGSAAPRDIGTVERYEG